MSTMFRWFSNHYVQGWSLSLLLHAAFLILAVQFVSELRPPAMNEPFRWEVTLADASRPEPVQAESPLAPMPESAALVSQPKPTKPVVPRRPTTQQAARPRQPDATPPVKTTQAERHVVEQKPLEPIASIQEPMKEEPAKAREVDAPPAQEPAEVQPESTRFAQATSQPVEPSVRAPSVAPEQRSPQPAPAPSQQPALPTNNSGETHSESMQTAAAPPPSSQPAPQPPGRTEHPVASHPQTRAGSAAKLDYGWLAQTLWRRIEQLKRYPYKARLNRWQGTVVVRAVIRADGQLTDLVMESSSGHPELDQDALELLRRAFPVPMQRDLGRPEVTIRIPIKYYLE